MDRILVVEDIDSLREVLVSVLESEGFIVDSYPDAEKAIASLRAHTYSCILADFKLPGMNGIELLQETRKILPNVPYVIMTAYGSIDIAVDAMKLGATDFICKPFEPSTLSRVLSDVITHKRILDRGNGLQRNRPRTFLTQDSRVERLLYQARKVAAVDSTALILGESGTGKELLARYIHENSPRHEQLFMAVNCAAMPPTLLESEFFGHEAGAFTGATQSRTGILELASEGTIFLDEIGEMPPALQVKLLRALQEREIKRVGGSRSIKIKPRILAATNRDLEQAVIDGTLREDFYYRIAVISFTIPPLRERLGDIDLLTKFYLDYFSTELGREIKINDKAMDILRAHSWPGNARELENVIERAVILAEDCVTPDLLGIGIDFDSLNEAQRSLTEIAALAAKRAEIDTIKRILERTDGNKSKAARLLGVSYKTLLNKVREYEGELSAGSSL